MAAKGHDIPDLAAFEGQWSLARRIMDLRAKAEGRLTGEVVFAPRTATELLYEESGMLSYGSQPPMAATRRYIWRQGEEGIEVFFEDERPFHVIEAGRTMPDANHHCDPDLYHVSYDFTRWPEWSTTWRVVGPKKDYRMVSEFLRVG